MFCRINEDNRYCQGEGDRGASNGNDNTKLCEGHTFCKYCTTKQFNDGHVNFPYIEARMRL